MLDVMQVKGGGEVIELLVTHIWQAVCWVSDTYSSESLNCLIPIKHTNEMIHIEQEKQKTVLVSCAV